jgi:hypothetical protein
MKEFGIATLFGLIFGVVEMNLHLPLIPELCATYSTVFLIWVMRRT